MTPAPLSRDAESSERSAARPPALPSGSRLNSLWPDAAWLLVLTGWAAGWCLTAAPRLGPTYDEPFYLLAGLHDWHLGRPDRLAGHGVMPLPVEVATYPLHEHDSWLRPLDDGTLDRVLAHLPAARRTNLLWMALLLVSVLRLGRAAGGPWAGRVAAGLVAADPTVLAHATLATTDLSVTAALAAFARAAYVGRGGGLWGRVLLPGLWFGFAVLCKLSALLYGGVILVAFELAYRVSSGAFVGTAGRVVGAAVRSALAVGAVVAVGVGLAVWYCGDPPADAKPMAEMLPKIAAEERMKPEYPKLAEAYPRPPYAAVALAFQAWRNRDGWPAYLNGTYYPAGCWFHFPVLLAMKAPLPVLLLGLAALARPRAVVNPLSLAAALLLAATLTAKVQTGVRLVLPVMVVGYVAVAVGVCRGFPRWGPRAGLAAVAVTAAVAAWVWPHGLGYLNVLAGGPAAAHRRVSDSNLDWGQGVPDLLEWHRANGEPPLAVWYFGTDPAAARPPLHPVVVGKASPIRTADDFRAAVGSRYLAVGESVLGLHPFDPPPKEVAMRELVTRTPVARTATFAIYDFRDPPVE